MFKNSENSEMFVFPRICAAKIPELSKISDKVHADCFG